MGSASVSRPLRTLPAVVGLAAGLVVRWAVLPAVATAQGDPDPRSPDGAGTLTARRPPSAVDPSARAGDHAATGEAVVEGDADPPESGELVLDPEEVLPAEEPDEEDDGYETGFLKNWAALPLVLYTPETQVVGSVLGVYFFPLGDRAVTRPSSIKGVGALSTRGQSLVNLEDELWFEGNVWRLKNIFQYRNWPDTFYGVGHDARNSDAEGYTYVRFQLLSRLERVVWRKLYVGLVQHAEWVDVVDTKSNGILETQNIPGCEGGWASGLGLSLTWDDRDSALYPTSGGFYRLEATAFQGFLGSDYDFGRIEVDLRNYFVPWLDHVLAFQLVGGYSPGDVPFTMMPRLGGSRNLRGLFSGRFRDKGALSAQMEYRFPLFWKLKMVAFGGAGQVFRDFSDLSFPGFHYTVGGGLRFQISDERPAHVRFDVGWSPVDGPRFYLQVLEAF